MPSGKPKRQGEKTWDNHVLSKGDISNAVRSLKGVSLISQIFDVLLGKASPHLAAVSTAYSLMSTATEQEKEDMIVDANDILLYDSKATGVLIKIEYSGYQKGSQGLFWISTGRYKIVGATYSA